METRGKPLSSAASISCPSSHAEPSVPSAGRSQTLGKSTARSAEATTSASSGRWAACREPIKGLIDSYFAANELNVGIGPNCKYFLNTPVFPFVRQSRKTGNMFRTI